MVSEKLSISHDHTIIASPLIRSTMYSGPIQQHFLKPHIAVYLSIKKLVKTLNVYIIIVDSQYTSAMLSIFGRAGATLLVVVNELLALYNDVHIM